MINTLWGRVDDAMVSTRNLGKIHPMLVGRIEIMCRRGLGSLEHAELVAARASVVYFRSTIEMMKAKSIRVPSEAYCVVERLESLLGRESL